MKVLRYQTRGVMTFARLPLITSKNLVQVKNSNFNLTLNILYLLLSKTFISILRLTGITFSMNVNKHM